MRNAPYRIHVTDDVLEDLKGRLARTRWPDDLEGAGWECGFDRAYLHELTAYWRGQFDWRARERALNAFSNFRADVGGVGVHFIHERGVGRRPLPLLLTHGWPGTFAEFVKIIPLLTDPGKHGGDPDDAFDVVVPSIPGYGFSDRPSKAGMSGSRVADLWASLMEGLGYARFGAQGGDWGATIATWLAVKEASSLVGIHLNYIPGSYRPHTGPGSRETSEAERRFLDERARWIDEEGAYGHIQATRPQTLAFGLNDSPAALAAWIVEKFREWGDCGGDVERRFSRDELLTHVTIYWATQTIGSSMRLYHESRGTPLAFQAGERIHVPAGVARFAKEAPMPPREWVERVYDVRRWTEFPRGGHFAAMEEPEMLASDIREFFRPLR
jgi:pimeloyl-ACP methyl ester carboxylesterase